MERKYVLNFGNLFYLIEVIVGIGQTEIDECVSVLNKNNNLGYVFNKSNYCKIKRCERRMFQYIYDERIRFVPIVCKEILKDEMIKFKFMNLMFEFCNNVVQLDSNEIDRLKLSKEHDNVNEFILCLIEVANCVSNNGSSLFKERVNIQDLLLRRKNEKTIENESYKPIGTNITKVSPDFIEVNPRKLEGEYVEREQQYSEIVNDIEGNFGGIIAIYGLPGNGKTSLMKKIFDNILPDTCYKIWFSAKHRPNELKFEYILNEILRAFGNDRPSIISKEEKESEVNRLLTSKYIFVLDDLEKSPEIEKVLEWVFECNERNSKTGSRFILTTQDMPEKILEKVFKERYPLGDINDVVEFIQIPGMHENEMKELILKRIEKTIHLKRIVLQNNGYINKIINKLSEKTNGNPQAIKVAISYIENMIKSGNELDVILVTDTIWDSDDIVKKMFKNMWENILDEDIKRVIATVALIPKKVTAKRLFEITNIPEVGIDGIVDNESRLGKANRRAIDSSMVELRLVNEMESKPMYTKHGLVNDFIRKMLIKDECPIISDIDNSITEWYLNKCENIKYCWDNMEKLKFLDEEIHVIYAIMKKCYESQKYDIVLRFSSAIRYYLIVRNIFFENIPSIHQLSIKSAEKIGDVIYIIKELICSLNILSKRGDIDNAKIFYELLKSNEDEYTRHMNSIVKSRYNHAVALYYYSQNKHNDAIKLWKTNESFFQELPEGDMDINLRWMARCYKKMNEVINSKEYFSLALKNATANKFKRSRIDADLYLIELDLLECDMDISDGQRKNEELLINRLISIKDDMIYTKDKNLEAKWYHLYSKALYCSHKIELIDEMMEHANESYKIYAYISYREKQEEIKEWIDFLTRSIKSNDIFNRLL